MRYFTRDWCNGKLTDEQYQRAIDTYGKYTKKNYPKFPSSIKKLLRQNGLHDSLIRSIEIDKLKNRLVITFLSGDLQIGYFDFEVKYHGVKLSKKIIEKLYSLIENKKTEFLYDEIRIIGKDMYQHSIIFWPRGEISIECHKVECKITSKLKNREIRQRTLKIITS